MQGLPFDRACFSVIPYLYSLTSLSFKTFNKGFEVIPCCLTCFLCWYPRRSFQQVSGGLWPCQYPCGLYIPLATRSFDTIAWRWCIWYNRLLLGSNVTGFFILLYPLPFSVFPAVTLSCLVSLPPFDCQAIGRVNAWQCEQPFRLCYCGRSIARACYGHQREPPFPVGQAHCSIGQAHCQQPIFTSFWSKHVLSGQICYKRKLFYWNIHELWMNFLFRLQFMYNMARIIPD